MKYYGMRCALISLAPFSYHAAFSPLLAPRRLCQLLFETLGLENLWLYSLFHSAGSRDYHGQSFLHLFFPLAVDPRRANTVL